MKVRVCIETTKIIEMDDRFNELIEMWKSERYKEASPLVEEAIKEAEMITGIPFMGDTATTEDDKPCICYATRAEDNEVLFEY